ncbi:hypothetical protein BSKO_01913 [Bryopsis sp. KO-2023]|nr:hypothetical protein BSKO_01913 [Bryopsis sp. KO-2023]
MSASPACVSPAEPTKEKFSARFFKTKKRPVEEAPKEQGNLVRRLIDELGPAVDEKLVKGGEEGLTEGNATRYLRSEEWDLEKAVVRLRKHADWRIAYAPEGRIGNSGLEEELADEKVFLQPPDKSGRSLIVVLAKNHTYSNDRAQSTTARLAAYALDLAIAFGDPVKNPEGKIVAIFDLGGIKYKNLDTGACKALFGILEKHYPERLEAVWLYNAPTIFWTVWKVLEPFLDKVTKEKIKFVYGTNAIKQFKQVCDPHTLPPELGGTGALKRVQDCWVKIS